MMSDIAEYAVGWIIGYCYGRFHSRIWDHFDRTEKHYEAAEKLFDQTGKHYEIANQFLEYESIPELEKRRLKRKNERKNDRRRSQDHPKVVSLSDFKNL